MSVSVRARVRARMRRVDSHDAGAHQRRRAAAAFALNLVGVSQTRQLPSTAAAIDDSRGRARTFAALRLARRGVTAIRAKYEAVSLIVAKDSPCSSWL